MDEIKKKTFVRKDALEAETAAKRKRKRPKGYLGCILGLTIGIAGLAAARLGHLWVGFDIFSHLRHGHFSARCYSWRRGVRARLP